MAYLLGRIIGAIFFSFVLGFIVTYISAKIIKKPFQWKWVIVSAFAIYLLATIGRIGAQP
jgi:hypothetical protein